ncbi:MAG: hypothetical protein ACKVTZ_02695 [Bacteroidia bacterium]
MHLKIGIIHIQSGIFPLASYDFADAVVAGLEKEGFTVEIIVQDAEGGTNAKLISEKALKLFRADKVATIFTLAENNSIVEALEALVVWIKKPVFIASFGARLGTPPTPSGYLYFVELDAWKSAWAAGREMSTQYARVAQLSALYEAGYQFAYAFFKGVAAKEGSLSPAIYVIKEPKVASEIEKMFTQIAEGKPEAFYLTMSFKESAAVLSAYSQSEWANTPLFITPFALNEYTDIQSLANIPNLYELSAINEEKMQREPLEGMETTHFSLLGYEAGRIFGRKHQQTSPEDITIDSPRGEITLLKDTFHVVANQYLYKISVENGNIKKTLVKTITDLPDLAGLFAGETQVQFSQWANPYLFA